MVAIKIPIEVERLRKWRFLGYYLSIYTTIISNNFPRFYYIDALAGSGKYNMENIGEVEGSPLLSLKIKFPFTHYIFIENKEDIFRELKDNVEEFKTKQGSLRTRCKQQGEIIETNVDVQCCYGNVKDLLKEKLSEIPNNVPCFVFLDPYGIEEIPWNSTVKVCLERDKTELLINFSLMGITRCIGARKTWRTLNNFFGEDRWKDFINSANPLKELTKLYMNKLSKDKKWVVKTPPIKNETGFPVYCLIFATNNDTAHRIWKEDVIRRVPEIWQEKDLMKWIKSRYKPLSEF